jgi:RimJ/RimL family protein N-acetyltransferase
MTLSNLLTGTKVYLTSLTRQDMPVVAEWYQNAEFLRLFESGPAYPKTEEALIRQMEEDEKSKRDFPFAVRLAENGLLIGLVVIDGVEWNNRVGGLALGLGNPAYWGKGYGFEAAQLVLTFAFNELNLHRIQLGVFGYNKRAIALYEKLGFQKEGAYREYILRDGRRFDMYLYGLLRPEWESQMNL